MYYITAFLFMQCEFFLKNGLKSIDIFFFNAIIDKQKIKKFFEIWIAEAI